MGIYLLIALILVVAIAPLLQFAPSKRQRRIARLREAAALQGLFVEFRQLPAGTPVGGEDTRVGDVVFYGLRLPPQGQHRRERASWQRQGEEWRPLDRRQPVPAELASLPAGVVAASADDACCGVYWVESAEPGAVARIHQALAAWSQRL